MTLVVETDQGTFLRRVAAASILPAGEDVGSAAEAATRQAAELWGLPDFVLRPAVRRHGRGVREVGDAIVLVGNRAASVQVKARISPSADESRERLWLDKKIAEAARQAAGTVRSLSARPSKLVNARGRLITIDGAVHIWRSVVILDHPGVPGYVPRPGPVVLLRRDWEFLFEQLKSTYAVLEYVDRVGKLGPIELGTEPVRYYQLAAADRRAPKQELDPRLIRPGYRSESVPLLPQEPAAHGEIIRNVLEDIAASPWPAGTDPADVLRVLAGIDAAPVGYRIKLGRDLLAWLSDVAKTPSDEVRWRFRRMAWPDRPYLIFGAAPRFDRVIHESFVALIRLRHQEHLELVPERADLLTVGVLLTPRRDGLRPWDTTLAAVQGEQDLDPELRKALDELWNTRTIGSDEEE